MRTQKLMVDVLLSCSHIKSVEVVSVREVPKKGQRIECEKCTVTRTVESTGVAYWDFSEDEHEETERAKPDGWEQQPL